MAFIQTERGKFFYLEYQSEGALVYLLHGLTAKCQDWGAVPDLLAKIGFHVFSFDMRGHGRSDKPESGYAPEDHARDIEACSRALGHDRVNILGHSTGGRNALVFAGLFPERTKTLTIVDQTLTANPDSWKKYFEDYALYPTPFSNREELEKHLTKKFKGKDRQREYYLGQFWRMEDGRWDWNFSPAAVWKTQQLGRDKEIYDWLNKVRCPLLFIKGAESSYVSSQEVGILKDRIATGEVVVVEKAGHAVFRDNLEGFLGVLLPFLKQKGING